MKLNIGYLEVFTYVVNVHVYDSRRQKLHARSRNYVFISYGEKSKGYKLNDLVEKRLSRVNMWYLKKTNVETGKN